MMKMLLAVAIAIALLVEVLIWRRRQPRTSADHVRAGDRALRRDELGEAEELYREAVRLDHTNAEARYGLATVAWFRGELGEVVEHLRQCQRWAPDAPEIEHGLAAVSYRRGDREAAIEHYRRAIELDPDAWDTRESLASLYHELGRPEEAKAVCPGFEAPGPQAERTDRVWDELGPKAYAGLERWGRAAGILLWVWRVSRVGVLAYLALLALAVLYELLAGSGKLRYPDFGPAILVPAAAALVGMLVGFLGLRFMSALSDGYARRVMRRSGVSEDGVAALLGPRRARPWWRTEASGLHLILWLAIPFFVLVDHWEGCPDWMGGVAVVLGFIWVVKVCCWLFLVFARANPEHGVTKAYRWAGTLRGSLVLVVAVPAGIFLFGLLTLLIADLLGY